MKMNVKITKKDFKNSEKDKEIVNIDICNGNWKYNDYMMETDEKIPLTINTINKAHYLNMPVKDVFPFYDNKSYEEKREIKVIDASVRTYNSLLSFLNFRLDNVKEDYKKGTYKLLNYDEKGGRDFNAVLFENRKEGDVVEDIVYEKEFIIEVKIAVIE